MPLDQTGRAYATKLFQDRMEELIQQRNEEMNQVAADFGRRNMIMSGVHISARGRVLAKYAGLVAEALADTLQKAYEKSGLPFDDAALQEITTEVTQHCEVQKQHVTQAVQNLVQQCWPGAPQGVSDAVSQQTQNELGQTAARITRRLSIKRDEVILDEMKSRRIYAAGLGKEWDVFVSHASEDKEDFVRGLAKALEDSGLKVWYDERTLTVGDSLREAIDTGLARSRYGIVVLSKNFFGKQWPRNELDGLTAKEVAGVKVILPVWHNISAEEVAQYSPTLAGRFAAKSRDGLEKVVQQVRLAMGL